MIGKQTNNRAEITVNSCFFKISKIYLKINNFKAAIIAIHQAIHYKAKELILYTDSQFTINCMTKWINKWKLSNWKLSSGESVKNVPDLKYLDSLCSQIKVNWVRLERKCE